MSCNVKIESVLVEHPDVAESAVVPIPHNIKEYRYCNKYFLKIKSFTLYRTGGYSPRYI